MSRGQVLNLSSPQGRSPPMEAGAATGQQQWRRATPTGLCDSRSRPFCRSAVPQYAFSPWDQEWRAPAVPPFLRETAATGRSSTETVHTSRQQQADVRKVLERNQRGGHVRVPLSPCSHSPLLPRLPLTPPPPRRRQRKCVVPSSLLRPSPPHSFRPKE